ncbi:hypothetical protein V2J09_006845 [Rumex salicifolius]
MVQQWSFLPSTTLSQDESFIWKEASQLYNRSRVVNLKFMVMENLVPNNEETQEAHVKGEDCHVDQVHCSLLQEDYRSNQNDYTSDGQAPEIPPPTSDWLEETLIDMYLSGYRNLEPAGAAELEKDDDHKQKDDEEEGDYTCPFTWHFLSQRY